MPIFFHDRVLFQDDEGFAFWRAEHSLEHQQFAQLGLKATPTFHIPEYDFGVWAWDDALVREWLDAHENAHQAARIFTNVSGVDLSLVDFKQASSWYEWHDAHANEHVLIRQNLAIS